MEPLPLSRPATIVAVRSGVPLPTARRYSRAWSSGPAAIDARRAVAATTYEKITSLFVGPTAIAYSSDPVSAAKVLQEFSKKNGKLVLVGGAFGETILDKAAIAQLAMLPSLDELRAQIIALLQTPATRIAGVLQAPAGQLARVMNAYATKDAA